MRNPNFGPGSKAIAKNTRTQVGDLNEVALQPQARPVDTFVRAGGVDPSQGLRQLAESLRTVSPGLHATLRIKEENDRKEAERRVENLLTEKTTSEILAERKAGNLTATSDEYERRALEAGIAYRLARHREDDLMRRIAGESTAGDGLPSNAIDIKTQNIDEIISDQYSQDLQDYGLEAGGIGATLLSRSIEKTRERILDHEAKVKAEEASAIKYDAAYESFNEVLQTAKEQGWDAATTQKALQGQLLENTKLFDLPKEVQNEHILKLADHLASQGDYALAEQLLLGDRTLPNGQAIPGLGKTGRYADATVKILDKARANAGKNLSEAQFDATVHFSDLARQGELDESQLEEWRNGNPHVISDSAARGLIVQSRAARDAAREKIAKAQASAHLVVQAQTMQRVIDETVVDNLMAGTIQGVEGITYLDDKGKEKSLTPKQVQDRATETFLSQVSPRIAAQRGLTPEQQFVYETEVLAKNGLEYPKVTRILNAGPASLGTRAITGSEELPPNVVEGYKMYRTLKTLNPSYLDTHIKSQETRDFYEAMLTAQEYLGIDNEQQAALVAHNALYGEASVNEDVAKDEIESAANNLEVEKGFFNDIEGGDVRNTGILTARVKRQALIFRKLGLPADEAVKRAAEVVEPTVMVINKWAVPTGGTRVPEGFKGIALDRIETVAEKLGVDAADLTISPVGGNRNLWTIVYGATGLPVKSNAMTIFTTEELFRQHLKAKEQARAAAAEQKTQELNANIERKKEVTKDVLGSGTGFSGGAL